MDNTIVVSTPPHVKSKRTTRGIMLDVLIALLPCAIAGIVFFGWRALVIELVAVVTCVATEFVYFFILNKGFSNKCADAKKVCLRWVKQFDLTSVITGLILALILSSDVKWYEVIIGSIFAIAVVKMLFGDYDKIRTARVRCDFVRQRHTRHWRNQPFGTPRQGPCEQN